MTDLTSLRDAMAALPGRHAWTRVLTEQRDRCVADGRHVEATFWNELACVLAELRDEERAILRALEADPEAPPEDDTVDA